MSPKRHQLREGDAAYARARRVLAEKHLEAANLLREEDGAMLNVCVSLCVLSGIAAADAISAAATGRFYSGPDHSAAADHLTTIDAEAGKRLRRLVLLKSASNYGSRLHSVNDRTGAVRDAGHLVNEALKRTT